MKNQARTKTGKFKKAIEQLEDAAVVEEPLSRLLTKVTGQNTTVAALQTHNLKWKDGEPQPEFIGEQPPDPAEGEKENEE